MSEKLNMEKLVSLCKRRGFYLSEFRNIRWHKRFLGLRPIRNCYEMAIQNLWWKYMVETRSNVEGLDSTIICNPKIWKASGHLDKFGDLMTDCKECKTRHRVDQMEDPTKCPNCGSKNLTEPREFNLDDENLCRPCFDEEHVAYLRAETCQPIFADFHNVRIASRQKLPFGIAQVGKAFRNEINPRNFTFRSREFTQMEMEFFCSDEESMEWYNYWKKERINYYYKFLNFSEDKLRIYEHEKLAHYAKAALDIEFEFPFGWGELEGIHHRGTWDMSRHQEFSGENLEYFDQDNKRKFTPTVVETSVGLDRTMLAILCNSYDEDTAETQKVDKDEDLRVVMHIPFMVSPVQIAVLPLSKKLSDKAEDIFKDLRKFFRAEFDVTGSIGKRYRRQDEIGTPYCITVDFDTMENNTVTVRDRDTMEQIRISADQLFKFFHDKINL